MPDKRAIKIVDKLDLILMIFTVAKVDICKGGFEDENISCSKDWFWFRGQLEAQKYFDFGF